MLLNKIKKRSACFFTGTNMAMIAVCILTSLFIVSLSGFFSNASAYSPGSFRSLTQEVKRVADAFEIYNVKRFAR